MYRYIYIKYFVNNLLINFKKYGIVNIMLLPMYYESFRRHVLFKNEIEKIEKKKNDKKYNKDNFKFNNREVS